MGSISLPRQEPSRFEKHVVRTLSNPNHEFRNSHARTPHHLIQGTITPSALAFTICHSGLPDIDPEKHRLVDPRHGQAAEGLHRSPISIAIRRSRARRSSSAAATPRRCSPASRSRAPRRRCTGSCPTASGRACCVSTLFEEVGVDPNAKWFVAEGADSIALHRSVPVKKGWGDAMIALYQNGERVAPGNGYPMRLLLPGYQGNMNVKHLRRIKLIDQPAMSFYEAKTYSQVLPGERFWRFNFVQEVKSFITHPSFGHSLKGPGYYEISGVAYSGNGRISRVMVSADGGKSWARGGAARDAPAAGLCPLHACPGAGTASRSSCKAAPGTRPATASRCGRISWRRAARRQSP